MAKFVLKYRYAARGPLAAIKRADVIAEAKDSSEAIALLAASLKEKAEVLVNVDSVKELK